MLKKISLVLLLILSGSLMVFAQRTITGKVVDKKDQEGLIGASILIKGTTTGTVTDLDGSFSLNVPEGADVLLVSYTGYATQEVQLDVSNVIDIQMKTDNFLLSEIIVTGQGVGIEKKRLSSTVDVITAEDLAKSPINQLDQILQSKLPTSQIRLSSGQPGTASIIRSRGPVSAVSNTTPVIYIDGVRVDNLNSRPQLNVGTGGANSSALSDIPVENIERIEFLKGGAATTLYGSDAANGVIQIFTKRGKSGQARINAEVQLGALMGTEDYLRFPETADILYETGLTQSYRLGVEGGSDAIQYGFSGNIYGDDGFNDINSQERYNFRSTLSAKVSDKVQYTTSASFTGHSFNRDWNANSGFARFGGLEGGGEGDLSSLDAQAFQDLKDNYRLQGENTDITEDIRRFIISNRFEVNFSPKLSAAFGFGVDNRTSIQKNILTNAQLVAKGAVSPGTTDQGSITSAERKFLGITGDFSLRYIENLDDLSFITTVGGQFFKDRDEQVQYTANNVAEGSESINNAADRQVTDFLTAVTNYGFYATENVGFKNQLFLLYSSCFTFIWATCTGG